MPMVASYVCPEFLPDAEKTKVMRNFIEKNWITALGIGFIFTAFLYFLKLAVQNGWLPLELRIAISVLFGISGLFAGYTYYNKGQKYLGEILAGIGTSILYATIGYLSFSDGVNWSTSALLISMAAISASVSAIAVRQNMRVLFLISLFGGMITPFVIRATEFLDVPLFIYLLVLNVAALYASICKKWTEMKVISFVLSIGLYAVYYSLFDPEQWTKPFFYVSSIFLVYMVGLLLSSWKAKEGYNGIDLYLGLVNGVNFIFWSTFIFKEFSLPHAIPLLIVGLLFMGIATFIFFNSDKKVGPALGIYAILGVAVLGIAGSDLGLIYQEGGLNYTITSSIWLLIIGMVYYVSRILKERMVTYAAMAAHFLLIIFWYSVAWDVEWIEFFGIPYIPFLNFGALIWMGLIFLGFSISRYIEKEGLEPVSVSSKLAAQIMALVSHILVGGLLTVQIMNLWEAYDLSYKSEDLTLSACWFLYALVLFLWGNTTRQKLFKIMGSIVLFVSAAKVFLWDLEGNSSIEQIIFLTVLGGLTLLIAKVNNKQETIELPRSEDIGTTEQS